SIEAKEILGTPQEFFTIEILESGAMIMVPVDNAISVGLRKVVDKSVVTKVYAVFKEKREGEIDSQTWNRRYREYMDKIKTGCVIEIAKVLRDIYLLKTDKELSFGERRMMDTARNLLIKEISIVKNTKEDRIERELDRLMNA
ncbi:MAG: CarD family transcriptional regulator, partial [Zetaproteobacteria bacterium]|nr:CarD family transcriptional regulator [Zetaproteobacteria bacterium]